MLFKTLTMKKTIIFLFFILLINVSFSQEDSIDCTISAFRVALDDQSDSDTNIRDKPNGEIILKLNKMDYFELMVVDIKNGWLKINNIVSVEYDYTISNLQGWIHHSIVGVFTRRNLTMVSEPYSKKIVGSIEQEIGVKIKGACSNWVQIEYNGISGWVESKWLCGSPVTTCP